MDTTGLDKAIEEAGQADATSAFTGSPEPVPVQTWPAGLPSPGIYPGVSYEEYRAWPAINASALKILASVTPKHCKAYIDGLLNKDTPDRKKGRAFHCACLEPTEFSIRFPLAGTCPELIASGKRKGEPCGNNGLFRDTETGPWYCGVHVKSHPQAVEVAESLTQEQREAIEAMRKEIFNHKVVSLIRQHGGAEVSIVWDRDGVPCKSRADKLIIDRKCPDAIIDLKKIQPMAGVERSLQSAISNYGYDLAAWWYVDGVKRLRPDKPRPLFAWIFAEDAPPFDVRPAWASKRLLEIGRIKAEKAFETYRWCMSSGQWPGYCNDIEEIEPSDWEAKRFGLNQ